MTQKFCGSCGKSLENATNFCTHCGEPIKNNKEVSSKSIKLSKKQDDGLINLTFNGDDMSITIRERAEIAKEIERILDMDKLAEHIKAKTLWMAEEKTGFFKKPIKFFLTNNVIFCGDPADERTIVFPLNYVDVVVMNSHRVSSRTGIGGYTSLTKGAGIGGWQSSGRSVTVGDVNFLCQGEVVVTIHNVNDPSGLKSLVNQLKKTMNQQLKNLPNSK